MLRAACFFVVAALVLLAVFWDPISSGLYLWGPDSNAFGFVFQQQDIPESYLGNWNSRSGLGAPGVAFPFVPFQLLLWLTPALRCQLSIYMVSVVALILAGLYLLRGRGITGWSAFLASLALGLSAHSFSLIAAGHMGKLEMMPFAVLSLAALDRAITRRRLYYFAMAGVCTGFGLVCAADIMVVFCFLSTAYVLFLAWQHRPRACLEPSCRSTSRMDEGHGWFRYLLFLSAGALIGALFFLSVASLSLQNLFQSVIPQREAMTQTTGPAVAQEENKWEFATNWSLPPEEILEFFAPSVFGIQTGDPRAPYWGRLGRTLGWEKHHRGLMNLRQHTVYLGVIQLVFALFAVAAVFWRWMNRDAKRPEPDEGANSREGRPWGRERRAQVLFWAGAFVLSIMFALGRYFPIYRLFFMLPYASSIRCPVKFLHLSEVSLCVLMAFGFESFFSLFGGMISTSKKDVRRAGNVGRAMRENAREIREGPGIKGVRKLYFVFAGVCAVACVAFMVGSLAVTSKQATLFQLWGALGLTDYSPALLRMMTSALLRAALMFFLCFLVFLAAPFLFTRRFGRLCLSLALLVMLSLDLTMVARRFVLVWDEGQRFKSNDLIEALQRDREFYRASVPVPVGPYDGWKRHAFKFHGITVVDPTDPGRLAAEEKNLFLALQSNPLRWWTLTSTRDVVGPVKALGPLLSAREQVGAPRYFNVMQDGRVVWADSTRGQHVWFQLQRPLPRALVFHRTRTVAPEEMPGLLGSPEWDPHDTLLLPEPCATALDGGGTTPAKIVDLSASRVEIEVSNPKNGVLLLNDRFDPNWRVRVDGRPEELLRCNYLMRGVFVPEGFHRIVFAYRPYAAFFAASMAASVCFVLWSLGRVVWTRRNKRKETGSSKTA